jgi:hypothetical protein
MFIGGREASRGVVIGWRFSPLWYLPTEYRMVKWVLTRHVTPTFYKNKIFCPHRSAYQIVVHMKNFSKINLV